MPPYPLRNPMREKLLAGKISLGCWCLSGNALLAEVMGASGVDWVMMDVEHFPFHIPMLVECVRAVERAGAVPLARLPACDPVWIKHALDAGALGIVLPLIRTAGEVKQAVEWSRFPPLGRRPFGGGRVGLVYGDDYLRHANDAVLVMVQIETREALAGLDNILAVDGYDGCFVGPVDLSLSLGVERSQVETIVRDIGPRIRAAGKCAGTIAPSVDAAMELSRHGYQMTSCFHDVGAVRNAARAAQEQIAKALGDGPTPS